MTIKKSFIGMMTSGLLLLSSVLCQASWIWSPDLGQWMNPKNSTKDTPEEQFEWAMVFYNQGDWDRAIEELGKLPAAFPNSRLAAEGVYYSGLAWEKKGDLARAADAYQKLIDRYPYSDRIKDAIKKEFDIANQFASGSRIKLLGVPALPGQEKAIELYKHIVKNAPYGSYGDQAQYEIGQVYKLQGEFEEAQKAFQAVIDDYPSSKLVSQAKYQIAFCSMQASKMNQVNDEAAQRAIEEFRGFKESYPHDQKAVEAEESIRILREAKAKKAYDTAKFYENLNKEKSAKIYYQQIVSKYPDTSYAKEAARRVEEIVKQENAPKAESKGFKLW